jgi:phosphoribosylaminoimidazolecarboxamide formyltransferase/IMP cyclohydrolase
VKIKRALISVFDKTGLDDFVTGLVNVNPDIEIYSTGGTFKVLEALIGKLGKGKVISVSDYTGQPEMQGGLVKTLDFKIYLGILSEPYNPAHEQDRARVGAELFDLVCVNLYPFKSVLAKGAGDSEELRQNIDIGGPCMLRASAKAFLRVASLSDPADYPMILKEMSSSSGCLTLKTRKYLAAKTFTSVSDYDQAVGGWLTGLADPAAPYKVHA